MQNAAQKHHFIQTVRRDERQSRLADFLEGGRKSRYQEQAKAFIAANPDAPSESMYDYALMFEQGKMPEAGGEGFAFLPEEGYKLPGRGKSPVYGAGPSMTYDANSKSYQFTSWLPRTIAMGVKGAAEGVLKKGEEAYATLFSAGDKERFDGILEEFDKHRFEPLGPTVHNLKGNTDDTIAAAAEQLATELVEIGVDIAGAKASIGGKSMVKFGSTKNAFQKLIRRMEEAVTPAIIGGEMIYAINPDNQGTAAALLGEELENTWGMEGPLIEWLKTTDDNPYSQATAAVIEGMMLFEIGRTALRMGIKVPAAFWKGARNTVQYAKFIMENPKLMGTKEAQRGAVYYNGPSFKDGELYYRKMTKQYLDVLHEDAEIEDVIQSLDEFSPELRRVLKALDNEDWLGFDYPSQALDAVFSRELDNFDVGQRLKAAVGSYVNKGGGVK